MIYLISWYVQDFLWVLGSGKVLVPEFFLLALVFLSLFRFEDGVTIFWAAFLGGVLWDLRWIGFPGFSSLFYIGTLMIVRWIWFSIPASGRTVSFFGFLFWVANVPTSLGRIFLWGARGTDVFYTYLLQQSYILPIVLLACAAYAWRLKTGDV